METEGVESNMIVNVTESRESENEIASYAFRSWIRLREVCQALQKVQEKTTNEREKVVKFLEDDAEYRYIAEQVQSKAFELNSLMKLVEKQKCRLMTYRIKMIRLNEERFEKDARNKALREETALEELKKKNIVSFSKNNGSSKALILVRLARRRRKMVGELMKIFCIDFHNTNTGDRFMAKGCACKSSATIDGLHLPSSPAILGHSDAEVSTAIGYVIQVLNLLSEIYDFPLQYRMTFFGSRSYVSDPFVDKIHPLHSIAKNKDRFNLGMFFLNKNLSQLRWLFNLPTKEIHKTLENLAELLNFIVKQRDEEILAI